MQSKISLNACLIAAVFAIPNSGLSADGSDSPRQRILLDVGWKFYLGNPWGDTIKLDKADSNGGPVQPGFSDADWRTVNLPHDWAVELPFDPKADCNHGFKPVGPGFAENDTAWYRRSFELPPADAGKRLWLEFDGVYQSCDVFVNGWFAGHHDDGYDGFHYEITALARSSGKNEVVVKVDASKFEGWFYEGAGIYRHVWLEITSPVAVAPDGIFVSSKFKNNIPAGAAAINVEATLLNAQPEDVKTKVSCEIISPGGKSVGRFSGADIVSGSSQKILQLGGRLADPVLWSPESPKLYRLLTTIESGGKVVDRKETEFGIRTIAYDPNQGFLLNGRHYEIQGTCNHQDAAGVGVAVPDALQYFRVAKLKEMGCNAYRTSHNAPAPEVLEACDRLGMLVLDENRLFGSDPANLGRLAEQIARDRNHPSIFTWSLGNEEWAAQDSEMGATVTRAMQEVAHRLDPTRPCTLAVNSGRYGNFGIFSALDVKGFNYHYESMDAYHAAFPQSLILGTEQASSIGTRGIYTNDATQGYVSAYDDHNPRWGCSAEEWWSYFATRPWASGGFDWTGFDYRGEPTPYEWPCISSHFGILDTCGFPKDNFWYYQSWWTTNVVLHLLPHWNWAGREGQDISVRALSNCQEVELFLNGQSLGRKAMKRTSELKWNVKYTPGVLSAKGYNDGKLAAETKVETCGEPVSVNLNADRPSIRADGQDVSVVTVAARDAENRVVPLARNKIHFELSGAGRIIGVGNGDPTCHEPDTFIAPPNVEETPENEGWRYTLLASERPDQAELQPGFDDTSWNKVNPRGEANSMKEPGRAVFRDTFAVESEQLASDEIQLKIGRIDDWGQVYVNGKLAGESRDWRESPSFDVKPFLRNGKNTIAIFVHNTDGAGGVGNGVALRFYKKPVAPEWQRSVFNGLAQVLVQSTPHGGQIILKATSDGLKAATIVIQAEATDGDLPGGEGKGRKD